MREVLSLGCFSEKAELFGFYKSAGNSTGRFPCSKEAVGYITARFWQFARKDKLPQAKKSRKV